MNEKSVLIGHSATQDITDDCNSTYNVTGLCHSGPKIILTALLTIFTGGFFILILFWYPAANTVFTKRKTTLSVAEFVYIKSSETEINGLVCVTCCDGIRCFLFQHLKYVFEDEGFVLVNGLENLKYSDIHAMSSGLDNLDAEYNGQRYGQNIIDVPVPSYFKLFFVEALQPFYIFQAFAVTLWMVDSYQMYATAILVISIFSIGITIYEQKKQKEKVNKMATSSMEVLTLRKGIFTAIESTELLPGDVLFIPRDGLLLCCDAVLVSGSAIVNECSLTGESVPVNKAPIPYVSKFIFESSGDMERLDVSEDIIYDADRDKKYSLFSGTTILQTKPTSGMYTIAIVTKTGFSTFKGSLIRSILCPKPSKFEFQTDATRFIIMLSCFAAIGFAYTCYVSVKFGATVWTTVKLGLDLITVVVPPALPAALTIGVVYAIQRLKKSNIFCIDPQRVNFCGKIQSICFDKTGTLTEDGLSVLCAVPSSAGFHTPVKDCNEISHVMFLHALATCHEISIIDKEYIGDPLDIEMFKFTKWDIEECDESSPLSQFISTIVTPSSNNTDSKYDSHTMDCLEVGIIRTFPFTSELQRMAVVTKNLLTDQSIVFCKGSPEMIKTLSVQESIPFNYDSELNSFTREGYRVIAFGWKSLDAETSWHKIQTIRRSQLECDLNFIGFLVMENHLKDDTTQCITDLLQSNTRVCMVTGDNILTATTVGKKCGIIPGSYNKDDVIIVKKEGTSVSFQLDFQDNTAVKLPEQYNRTDIHHAIGKVTSKPYVLAIAGSAFDFVAVYHPLIYQFVLLRGNIFARMKPVMKQKLVEDLQQIGLTVSMCGDGANDCGALKAAHAGVSLSEAEASIAAPFTSANPSISCMIEILRQGRAALVTASVTFRFMAMYSMIQFITQLLHYNIGNNMSDAQFLFIDLFVITGIAATLGHSQPAMTLAKCTPKAQLIDLKVFVLLTSHVIITFAFQVSFIYAILNHKSIIYCYDLKK